MLVVHDFGGCCVGAGLLGASNVRKADVRCMGVPKSFTGSRPLTESEPSGRFFIFE